MFRLHSRVTVLILFASCIIVSMGQFFGDPIDCLVDVSTFENLTNILNNMSFIERNSKWCHGHILLDSWYFHSPKASNGKGEYFL